MFVEWSSTKHILLSKPLNLIDCHDNQKGKFAKNVQKSTPQKLYDPICGIMLKLGRNVQSISLYKMIVFFFFVFFFIAVYALLVVKATFP